VSARQPDEGPVEAAGLMLITAAAVAALLVLAVMAAWARCGC